MVNHSVGEYVREKAHVNGMESFWSMLKRGYYGTYHRMSPAHLQRYVAEFAGRHNIRSLDTLEQMASTLNALRPVWDPNANYQTYSFVRQSQTFPDVILRTIDNGAKPLMGVELKGWYLLASEGVPTYRFVVTEAACNPWDLLVVVPWVLSNVLAGSPVLFEPFVRPAVYCAQQRNYYWKHQRDARGSTEIEIPDGVHPYPVKSDAIADKPASDSGRNFGRLARYQIMDEYVVRMLAEKVRGVPVEGWLKFFKKQAS